MGLRDDALAAAGPGGVRGQQELVAKARSDVGPGLAKWCRSMGISEVPRFSITSASFAGKDPGYETEDSATARFTFTVDGMTFDGRLEVREGTMPDSVGNVYASYKGKSLYTVKGLGEILRDEK